MIKSNSIRIIVVYLLAALLCVVDRSFAAGPTYPKVEASFQLPQVQGNPFDYTQNNVTVSFAGPDGSVTTVPAFFDGGQTWRARMTPRAPGKFTVTMVRLNGQDANPQALSPGQFDVANQPRPGFVRIDPKNSMRFAFEDGTPYYPVGYNLGWRSVNMPPITDYIADMGKSGVNWTRIWMCHWDGKNLDWLPAPPQPAPGTLDLKVAKLWDSIMDAAEAANVHVQMTLQHHGQYSTTVNPNWNANPWSKTNGGWLDNAEQFFTDPKAIALTKAKYRYIIARWGYSPNILAWEIFNEVQYTDGFKNALDTVTSWHAQMAQFLREQDPNKHLVTTSSAYWEPGLFAAMDYFQAHDYPADIITGMTSLDCQGLNRPYFFAEFGGGGGGGGGGQGAGGVLHRGLWASMMSHAGGAAADWAWDAINSNNQLDNFSAAVGFIRQSGLLLQPDMTPIDLTVQTANLVPLRFAPGLRYEPTKKTDYVVNPGGGEGVSGMPAYLRGQKEPAMFPFALFHVDFPKDGTFTINLDQMSRNGAEFQASVDGAPGFVLTPSAAAAGGRGGRGTRTEQAAASPTTDPQWRLSVAVPISAGQHTVRISDPGPDWVRISNFELTPYAPELGVLAKANSHALVAWIYRREAGTAPVTGTLGIPGLAGGAYQAIWWNTHTGLVPAAATLNVVAGQAASLATPPIVDDMALWIVPASPAESPAK